MPPALKHRPSCWILTDGRTGSENHSRGLAEALGLDYCVHPVVLRQPWKSLSPWVLRTIPVRAFASFPLAPAGRTEEQKELHWPDLLITTGRTPAVGALYTRRASRGRTLCVHIMQAGINPSAFDLLITPAHDRVAGENVLVTTGALHRVTEAKLQEARAVWEPRFRRWGPASFLAGLLVGGNTRGFTLGEAGIRESVAPFIRAVSTAGGRVIATCSRRTDEKVAHLIRTTVEGAGGFCWDGQGDNPYLGLLACADVLGVTGESVSMLSEAAFTGKPVWLLAAPQVHNAKLQRFHARLLAGLHARPFEGHLETWAPVEPLRDTERAAARVRALLESRGFDIGDTAPTGQTVQMVPTLQKEDTPP